MKLRLKDNSLRIRLTRLEVTSLGHFNPVVSSIMLGSSRLTYAVEISLLSDTIHVSFADNIIRVIIPAAQASAWSTSSLVGLYAEQLVGHSQTIKILIEKDFFCLKPRSHEQENEADMYPNPNAFTGMCG